MVPLPYSKLVPHAILGPQKSNGIRKTQSSQAPQIASGIRKASWPTLCQGKGPRGLPNPHNYCYRRSVLQALFHLPALIRVLEIHKPTTPLCDSQRCTCVACGLKKLSATYWSSESRGSALGIRVNAFDKLVNDRARTAGTKFMWSDSKWSGKGWRFTDQMDAHEFMGFLLDQLHDPQLPKKSKLGSTSSSRDQTTKESHPKLDPTSFEVQLEEVFQLCYRQRMKCHSCGVERDLHNQQKILGPLPLATSGTNNARKDLPSLLSQFFSSDAWEIKCENKACSKFNKPKFKNRISQSIVAAPEVLMIQLKCFRSQGKVTSKKNPNINYGHSLDLSKHASRDLLEREDGNIRYRLRSVILHQGSNLESGHYVGAYVGPNGAHHISDERVQKISPDALLPNANMKGTPYILTYVRIRPGGEDDQVRNGPQLTRAKDHVFHAPSNSRLQHSKNGTMNGNPPNHAGITVPRSHTSSNDDSQPKATVSRKTSSDYPLKLPQLSTNGTTNGNPASSHESSAKSQPHKPLKRNGQSIAPELQNPTNRIHFKIPKPPSSNPAKEKRPTSLEVRPITQSQISSTGYQERLSPVSQKPAFDNPFKMPGSKSSLDHQTPSADLIKIVQGKPPMNLKQPSGDSLVVRDGRPKPDPQHLEPQRYQGLSKSAIKRQKRRKKKEQKRLQMQMEEARCGGGH